ncbi:hypothetical protein [Streptomyces sp. NPDC048269]|uniref:hypothetical protein n=1 Tax=Streptomyces sp. NPDC048269 TaxID=3155753 RepID=UPI00344401E1
MATCNSIGRTCAHTRRSDPRLTARIHQSLGDAATVINVGAGSGSPTRAVRRDGRARRSGARSASAAAARV